MLFSTTICHGGVQSAWVYGQSGCVVSDPFPTVICHGGVRCAVYSLGYWLGCMVSQGCTVSPCVWYLILFSTAICHGGVRCTGCIGVLGVTECTANLGVWYLILLLVAICHGWCTYGKSGRTVSPRVRYLILSPTTSCHGGVRCPTAMVVYRVPSTVSLSGCVVLILFPSHGGVR